MSSENPGGGPEGAGGSGGGTGGVAGGGTGGVAGGGARAGSLAVERAALPEATQAELLVAARAAWPAEVTAARGCGGGAGGVRGGGGGGGDVGRVLPRVPNTARKTESQKLMRIPEFCAPSRAPHSAVRPTKAAVRISHF
ncbi:MAG: hypothetical protein IPL62_01415 [Caulobacteraceae bacterium]|nr:hypothetical protein [Caulobacteraceae bacterium]